MRTSTMKLVKTSKGRANNGTIKTFVPESASKEDIKKALIVPKKQAKKPRDNNAIRLQKIEIIKIELKINASNYSINLINRILKSIPSMKFNGRA
jgi:hypothetical protein